MRFDAPAERERLDLAWEEALALGPSGPESLAEVIASTRFARPGGFPERREPYWAIRQGLPQPRVTRKPPRGSRFGYDEYGIDATDRIVAVTRHLPDEGMTRAWICDRHDEALAAAFEVQGRLAAVGLYSYTDGVLTASRWLAGDRFSDKQLTAEDYTRDESGRVARIEVAITPVPFAPDPDSIARRNYHLRYGDNGALAAIGARHSTGEWTSIFGDFERDTPDRESDSR